MDESRLIEGLKDGDSECYRHFVSLHYQSMFLLANRLLGSQDDAQDCVQDACLLVVQKISEFRAESSLATWLHRIVVNQALSRQRRHKDIDTADIDALQPKYDEYGFLDWPVETPKSLDELIDHEETTLLVRESINHLPSDYRAIVLLRDLLGYTTLEAAEVLQISVASAKVRLHRARTALKSLLAPTLIGSGNH